MGPLDEKAKQAVSAALDVALPAVEQQVEAVPCQQAAEWQGENPAFDEVMQLDIQERSRLLDELEVLNMHWLDFKCRELAAHWLVVVDGQVIAHGGPVLHGLMIDERVTIVGQMTGKFPLIFIHPTALAIEEARWAPTTARGISTQPCLYLWGTVVSVCRWWLTLTLAQMPFTQTLTCWNGRTS